MKMRGATILIVLALLAISGHAIAQASCRNVVTVEMAATNNNYETSITPLDGLTNCLTITGFPTNAEALRIGAVVDSPGLYDFYVYPDRTTGFSADYSLTQQRALSGDGPLTMIMDSFYSPTYSFGIFGRGQTEFSARVFLLPILKLSDAVPSLCGSDSDYCRDDISYAGAGSMPLTRTLVVHCPGDIRANVVGDFSTSSQTIQVFLPGAINPVAQNNGRSITFTIGSDQIFREGLWKVVYDARGLKVTANPRLIVSAPRGDCRPGGSTSDTGTGTGGSTACAGVSVAGSCWYFGSMTTSCDAVCSAHGGYDPVTMSYAGSGGSPLNCQRVLRALSIPIDQFFETTQGGTGCFTIPNTSGHYGGYWDSQPTTSSATGGPGRQRICACQR